MVEFLVFFEFIKQLLTPSNVFLTVNNLNNTTTPLIKEEELQKINLLKIDENKISAKNVLIKEIKGPILYSRNIKEKRPIASLTKIMTALVTYTTFDEEEKFKVPKNFNFYEAQIEFKPGEEFDRNDLIKSMLISSSNASALLIASKISENEFVKKMNNLAKSLNLSDTNFDDVTGLSNKNISSLNDLYYLSEYILSNYPEIFFFSKDKSFTLKGKFNRILYNTNQLIYKYDENILGSKTGFTEEAGQCLIMIVKFPKSPLIFIGLLNSNDRFRDGEYILKVLEDFYKNQS